MDPHEDLQAHWWPVVARVARAVGDLQVAEDAVQDACFAALVQWPRDGVPDNPRAWLTSTARHKALDAVRREQRRTAITALLALTESVQDGMTTAGQSELQPFDDDQLALLFACCHPALDLQTRVALTLRAVCGMSPGQIAAALLVTEPALSKRLVRARRKIRDTGIPLRVPPPDAWPERLQAVQFVVLLMFTEGHRASRGPDLVQGELCDRAIALARELHRLRPDEPEVTGLLAMLLLTDARREARTGPAGEVVLLAEQDRTKYDRLKITEGERLLERALRQGRPGPFQIQAAIAACHSTARTADDTDWREVAALYGELLRYDPSPVHEANRAIAVAMAEGPAAGLTVLDAVAHHPQLRRWPTLHVARADLLGRLNRPEDAAAALTLALAHDPGAAERAFIQRRLAELEPDRPDAS